MYTSVEEICDEFAISGDFIKGQEINSGLINSTFIATYRNGGGLKKKYVLQRINETVFGNPLEVMENVERVTRHINWRVLRNKKDMGGQTLNLYPARGGRFFSRGHGGGVWRCYNFIEGCRTYDECDDPKIAYEAAKAFGSFLDLVSDFPIEEIHDTIPNFHHTVKRYEALIEAIEQDPHNRVKGVQKEITFIKERQSLCSQFIDLQESGAIKTRVTHNDTKINNVMIDSDIHEAVCVIDLDTVMPGLSLYDFGDLVRTSVSAHEEDSQDLNTVSVRIEFFKALAQGYVDGCSDLCESEIEHLPFAGKIMTLEVGIRFLTDYILGDHYFRTTRPNQNLDRCRTQLKLVEELEKYEPEFVSFFNEIAPRG